uniref:Si:dkey-85k7.12 n=1 Tax=Labrus bergylta TaxID=56723 RepID=A0A3Q3EXY0_9LABR
MMMVNVKARNVEFTSECESACDAESDETGFEDFDDFDDGSDSLNSNNRLNPLDIITALFLCSDGFVQQEMALKMSMCQFSVPLLLPNCDTKQCSLMLWAMRDIVKKYRPLSLSESKGFIEDRIVVSKLPMVSFVRLGECSLSKSETLNKLLSSSQQNHDIFVHRNMTNGDCPRRISNGLTEITWYLPCGNKNMDVFGEPVAVANLRGDIASFETQFSFLCHTSAAVFVFFDSLDSECKMLSNKHHKAQIFLVGNRQSQEFSMDAVKKVAKKLNLTKSNILLKDKQMNDATFVKNLHKTVKHVVENTNVKMQIEQMADIAHELGVLVDEDCPECQTAKTNADAITGKIQDIPKYKDAHLPLHGEIWKKLTCLEKEEFRLQQNSYDMSEAMTCFISAISRPGIERSYFLKWMRMNLDNLSRQKLSGLREEEIKEIDRQLSNSSLGIEHFFREMGQIYEASVSLPETNPSRQQFRHLPRLCAGLLLDGFPLELVDGDASNIPLRWVTDVLSRLNDLVSPKSKIVVVTVLGVQSTGKSTLLNTMFGVQFAVSSGRCTRGAFMLLIKVNENVKKELSCDFMVIIDTEGLKSPELAQLDNSYEHDNELATLVVGLSDITIINIAMENSTEMKDILQIVVHAFLRMKEVGKKPRCQFVHQNVADVSAPEKNLRERELLLEQLNEMTQAAARMEKKEENKSFTDVMEYNPATGNWYIPGLWNGSPTMAPVNAGYSEAVYELKKNVIQILGKCESSANDILEFTEWIRSLWNAVKHENFIFSFRNSLVADAYMRLCTEFNKWEWEFKKKMYSWTNDAEIKISNFGSVECEVSEIGQLLTDLKSDACLVLTEWETKLLENLDKYFKQTEGHVNLVEAYREDFANSAKSLRREMESSVHNQLTVATDVRKGMTEIDKIKVNHTKELEKRVGALIEECRKKKVDMTDQKLDEEFDKMWNKMVKEQVLYKQETFVKEKKERINKNNYHNTFIQEILHMIDESLKNQKNVKIEIEFEVSLKQHICAVAARDFQEMHEDFIQLSDPHICLNRNKKRFCVNFKDEFHERDQCQKNAKDFTDDCLRPAVENFINSSLGPDIIGEMKTRFQFSTRMFFQYSVLLDLLTKEKFEDYKSFICSYEWYVKKWILDEMVKVLTNESLSEFEDRHLGSRIKSINDAIRKAQAKEGGNLQELIKDIRQELREKLVISKDALGPFRILNNVKHKEFAQWLTVCVKEMEENIKEQLKKTNIKTKLANLDVKPENELFKSVIGCGKQCPFCKAPCEAGGINHKEHTTSLHRPEGLGRYTWDRSQKLVIDICTSLVSSDCSFRCDATKGEWHPYKEYTTIYPDWRIAPDQSLKDSDYWKYVLKTFNKEFSEAYKAKPADIPDTWKLITPQIAQESLKSSFNVK